MTTETVTFVAKFKNDLWHFHLHIKLKIFEKAFQWHIVCKILTSNKGDMLF